MPFHGEVLKAVRELVAANVALYPINPAGLEGSADNIQELAALKFSGSGYVLTFVPTGYREDGSFHKLRVETSRRNVELQYRIGYVADPSK